MPRSRSFTRLTMRVGLLHFGQSVDFVVSITFLRSPVLAILAIFALVLLLRCLGSHPALAGRLQRRGRLSDSLPPVYMSRANALAGRQIFVVSMNDVWRRPYFVTACA